MPLCVHYQQATIILGKFLQKLIMQLLCFHAYLGQVAPSILNLSSPLISIEMHGDLRTT